MPGPVCIHPCAVAAGLVVLLTREALLQGPAMHCATGTDAQRRFRIRAMTYPLAANGWLFFVLLCPDRPLSSPSLTSKLNLPGRHGRSVPRDFFLRQPLLQRSLCRMSAHPGRARLIPPCRAAPHLHRLPGPGRQDPSETIGRTHWKVKLMAFGLRVVFPVKIFTSPRRARRSRRRAHNKEIGKEKKSAHHKACSSLARSGISLTLSAAGSPWK